MNKITKAIFVVGITLILYGYLCRILNFYFFWESKYIGWDVILLGLISFLINRIKLKRIRRKKTIWEKIGIGLLSFVLLIQCVLFFVIPTTGAYDASVEYLVNHKNMKDELGSIDRFSIIPIGSFNISTSNGIQTGSAEIHLIVKGKRKYKAVTIYVEKKPQKEWIVSDVK